MIHLDFDNLEELKSTHANAIIDYVKNKLNEQDQDSLYRNVTLLHGFESSPHQRLKEDYSWLRQFILADVDTLRYWVENSSELLKFDVFKKLYKSRFSNGANTFVDSNNTYNSYTLMNKMGIKVCPYCEDQHIEGVTIGTVRKRTMEFDHFYPKGSDEYPALAMCFFNLIPSCITCNRTKLTKPVSANPYSEDIEELTHLNVDLPIGINMETLTDDECEIKFNPIGDMVLNVTNLALEERYSFSKREAYELLKKKQKYPTEKIQELADMGYGTVQSITRDLFGSPRSEAKGKELHTKLKWDLIGY